MSNKNDWFFDKFDNNFDRNFDRAFVGFGCLWVLWALFCLALFITAVVVGIHFAGKYW